MTPTVQEQGPCNCGCNVIGTKLKVKSCIETGCVVGCRSRICTGRRNKRKGRKAQARGYRLLGGSAPFTPGHEENAGTLTVEVQVEMKSGSQIPANFRRFIELEWTRRALSQAERAVPEGVQANPALYLEPPRAGRWLVVRLG